METDPGVQVLIEEQGNAEAEILDYHSVSRVIFYLRNVPNGIQHMSQRLNGQVETSLNLGILELKEDALTSLTSIRSSVKPAKKICVHVLRCLWRCLEEKQKWKVIIRRGSIARILRCVRR